MQKVDERTKQIWRCESRRVRTHHSTSEAAVRQLGRRIQRICIYIAISKGQYVCYVSEHVSE